MNYIVERYKNTQRFNEQYEEIHNFLLQTADGGCNEHFHWGRFEWMMCHTLLDVHELEKITLFRNKDNLLVGLLTYDTCFDGSAYLIHSIADKELLKIMVEQAVQNYKIDRKTVILVNHDDTALNEILRESNFVEKNKDNAVLEMSLEQIPDYHVPEGIKVSPQDFIGDNWKYQNVVHKGFDNEGVPQPWNEVVLEVFKTIPNYNNFLKVFAINKGEYCSHCGVWYTQGETAYIEPVATIPEFRKMGLAKAVVYEAIDRAKRLGAKRAVVISQQEFYFRIGFTVSSDIYRWEKVV